MLRRSNACLRYLGAGTRFGGRPSSDALLKASALRHTGLSTSRRNTYYSSSKAPLFDGEDEFSEPADSRRRFKRIHSSQGRSHRHGPQRDGSQWESFRNLRLSETMKFARNQWKRRRREIRGDSEEVSLLMDLSKMRGLPTGINSTVVSKELQWLNDPKLFADRVAALLDSGQTSLAVAMIRKAETTRMESSVAWNRLLSYCFKRGAPLAAFKFYNDMKKRGRSPTDHTYTIMLKGLCLRSRQSGVKPVELAYKIYQQLLSKSSGTVASLYHHHAMLEVCGTYYDMDTLWNVIGDLPEHGPNKPNAQTFTVILLALRNSFDNDIESLPEDKMELRKEKRERLVLDVKRIWADIISQWRKGQLDIDHGLISAMVRVLSDPLDELNTYNVLALFNQTMGVPIFIAKPKDLSMQGSWQGKWEAGVRSSKERPNYTPWQSLNSDSGASSAKELTPEDGIELSLEEELSVEEDNIDAKKEENWVDDLEGVFDPVKEANSEDGPHLLTPDNMVLNHILTVCRIMRKGTAAGRRYWNLFTLDQEGYKVQPDEGNFHEYLRLLRISRSSHTAGEVIAQQMVPPGLVEGKTIHIAMSCCLRDRMNPNVLINAQTLLKLMKENLPLPDPRALKGFIDLSTALTENPQLLLGLSGLDDIDSTTTNFTMMGRNLRWALSKAVIGSLEPHINRLYESMEKQIDEPSLHSKQPSEPPADAVNGFLALEFMVKVREMLDKLLGAEYKDVITKSDREWISPLAVKLRKFSKPEVASKLKKAHLRPLPHHYNDLLNQTKSG